MRLKGLTSKMCFIDPDIRNPRWWAFPYERPQQGNILYIVFFKHQEPFDCSGIGKYVCTQGELKIYNDETIEYYDGYEVYYERPGYVIETRMCSDDYEPVLLDECYWAYKNAFPADFKNILNSWSGSHVKIDKRIETEFCNICADKMLFGEYQQASPGLKF